jgi:hypothetical protein
MQCRLAEMLNHSAAHKMKTCRRFGRLKKEEKSVEVEEPKCWGKTSTRLGAYPCQEK